MELVKELLANGAPVRFPGCTPPALCRAVREGEVATARLLLEAGADPADEATSPVAYAILGGNAAALKLLLDAKASPDTIAPLRAGDTPALQFAVDRDTDDLQCSFVLMRAGARWQQGLPPDEKIKRRLIRAAYAGDEASVETLLAAHPHVQSDHFECLADALCEPWNQGGTGTSRISESVNVETPPPIIAALIAKRSGCVRLLLEYGAAAYRPPPPTGSGAIGASVLKSAQRSDDESSLILILQALRRMFLGRSIDLATSALKSPPREGDKTKSGATFVELSSLSPSDDDETEAPPPAGALRRKWFSHGDLRRAKEETHLRRRAEAGGMTARAGEVDMLDESLGLETYFVEQLDSQRRSRPKTKSSRRGW